MKPSLWSTVPVAHQEPSGFHQEFLLADDSISLRSFLRIDARPYFSAAADPREEDYTQSVGETETVKTDSMLRALPTG